jgi:hypothetical protein
MQTLPKNNAPSEISNLDGNPVNLETIASVRGSVVDALFPEDLPFCQNLFRAGAGDKIRIEVMTHLDRACPGAAAADDLKSQR